MELLGQTEVATCDVSNATHCWSLRHLQAQLLSPLDPEQTQCQHNSFPLEHKQLLLLRITQRTFSTSFQAFRLMYGMTT